jgi:hypothetical protein
MENSLIKLLAGNKDGLSDQEIRNGAMLVTLDSSELYFDLEGNRIKISDIVALDSDELPDYVMDNKLYIKNDGTFWIKLDGIVQQVGGNLSQEQIDTFNSKTNIAVSAEEPASQQKGDIWFIIEK